MPADALDVELAVGDHVRYQGRDCKVTKFDKAFPSCVEIDDPKAPIKWVGAKKTERWTRADELVKVQW